jgi:DNA-binding response OmpR family regulator
VPATTIILWEHERVLVQPVRSATSDHPVSVRVVHTVGDLRQALPTNPSPIVIIDHAQSWLGTLEVLREARGWSSLIVVIDREGLSKIAHETLRESGATAVLRDIPKRARLRALVNRLIKASQEQMAHAGGDLET